MKRALLATAVLAAATVTPTAAWALRCDEVWYRLTGRCSTCESQAALYDGLHEAAPRLVPERDFVCPDQ